MTHHVNQGPRQRDLLYSAAGLLLPLAAAMCALPILIQALGLTRFGLLMMMMAGVLYLSVLDLGIGTAITYWLSRRNSSADESGGVIGSATTVVLVIGLFVGAAMLYFAPRLASLVGDADLLADVTLALRVLGLAAAPVLLGALYSGVLAAEQRFWELNWIRSLMGVLSYAGPAAASLWMPSLSLSCAVLVAVRAIWAALLFRECHRLAPIRLSGAVDAVLTLRPLLRFGAWLTVSNLVGPIMMYMDRFYLGLVRSAEDVARYVTPYEIATRLTLLPAAVMPVLFPAFVRLFANRDTRMPPSALPMQTAFWIATACALAAGSLSFGAPAVIKIIGGGELAEDSVKVLRILLAATLLNCLAQVHFAQVQSTGRTDLIAKVHLVEVCLYIPALLLLLDILGIVGVALAWALRASIDAGVFCRMAGSNEDAVQRQRSRTLFWGVAMYSLLITVSAFGSAQWLDVLVLAIPLLVCFGVFANFRSQGALMRSLRAIWRV
ncbi:oligosaccharide flippase family protein [Ramlibacter rhizophilus]|uniref:Flippase n=1 Tax=Ramlibacter rhizophilus TaxID=1781167 RepID=A0A4Z0BHE4_9BURK|nr:oligosaccharide flippase family protein [Ramlibacter rhizophilus]TFY97893.1 hypothetical protein EZ242_15665 [Ramlibacter rhizophilus]